MFKSEQETGQPKKSHTSRFSARLQSDLSKQNIDTAFDKRHALAEALPKIPQRTLSDGHQRPSSISSLAQSPLAPLPKSAFTLAEMKRANSLPMTDSKPPCPPSNTSMNSMGSTDSLGCTASSPSLSPFCIDPRELWPSDSPEARSFRSASTQPSLSVTPPLSRPASKSTGQIDSLPSILSSRNKARRRALAGSPLAIESHIHSPRPNPSMLTNLDDLKRASSLPLDFESKSQPVALSDVGFTLFKKGRDRRNALEGLPTGDIKSTPRLSDPRELSFLTPIVEANTSSTATDDVKTSGPR